MIIKQHKGKSLGEADQSHNYTIDVNRTELNHINNALHSYNQSVATTDIADSVIMPMLKELDKFVENK